MVINFDVLYYGVHFHIMKTDSIFMIVVGFIEKKASNYVFVIYNGVQKWDVLHFVLSSEASSAFSLSKISSLLMPLYDLRALSYRILNFWVRDSGSIT